MPQVRRDARRRAWRSLNRDQQGRAARQFMALVAESGRENRPGGRTPASQFTCVGGPTPRSCRVLPLQRTSRVQSGG